MTIPRILIGLAVAVWLAAWGRALHTVSTEPPPARRARYTEDGRVPVQALIPFCSQPRLMAGAQVWQWCSRDFQSAGALVRTDLTREITEPVWTPDDDGHNVRVQAMAATADGGVVLALHTEPTLLRGKPDPVAIWRVSAAGVATRLAEVGGDVFAIGAFGDTLSFVARDFDAEGDTQTARIGEVPLAGGALKLQPCPELPRHENAGYGAFQAATHSEAGWTLWALRPHLDGRTGDRMQLPPGGEWTVVEVESEAYDPDPSGANLRPRARLSHDAAAGNGFWRPIGLGEPGRIQRLLYFTGTHWMPVPHPPASDTEARWQVAHYDLVSDVSVSGPPVTVPWVAWLDFREGREHVPEDLWATLGALPFDLARSDTPRLGRGNLKPLGDRMQSPGAPLAQGWNLAVRTIIGPARDLGWWVLGDDGAFVRTDTAFERVDVAGVGDRISMLIKGLQFPDGHATVGNRGSPLTRIGAVAAVLFGLPLFLLAFVWRRRWLHVGALAWLVLAGVCAQRFWVFVGPGFL